MKKKKFKFKLVLVMKLFSQAKLLASWFVLEADGAKMDD